MQNKGIQQSPSAKMAAMREVWRLRRLARGERHVIDFYVEHNLTEAARELRVTMLNHLRDACQNWRAALGIVPESSFRNLQLQPSGAERPKRHSER